MSRHPRFFKLLSSYAVSIRRARSFPGGTRRNGKCQYQCRRRNIQDICTNSMRTRNISYLSMGLRIGFFSAGDSMGVGERSIITNLLFETFKQCRIILLVGKVRPSISVFCVTMIAHRQPGIPYTMPIETRPPQDQADSTGRVGQ